MADNNVIVDPRYMTYNKDEVQNLLDKVNNADAEPTAESENMISSGAVAEALGNYVAKEDLTEATEQEVRNIVKNWEPAPDPEEEEAGE